MRLRRLAGPAIAGGVLALILAAACGGGSLPAGEFALDAAALDLPSCSDGSAPMPIPAGNCAAAACPGTVAYAVCVGSTYGACTCKGSGTTIDAGVTDEPFPTGSGEGGAPPEDVVIPSETGPSDTGPVETGPKDSGPKDAGPKDSGPKDTGPKDTGPADTGSADAPG